MTAEVPANPPPSPEAQPNAERLAARLALISEIARSAHAKLEVGELLTTVADATRRYFGYYDVSIFLVDPSTAECILVAHSGAFQTESVSGYRQKVGVGMVGWVAEQGRTMLANDVRTEPRHIIAFRGEEQSLSELAVPIRLQDHTVGVINIENREAGAFLPSDVLALETLAEQVAQAIANAQLFEQTRLLADLNRSIINAIPSALCVVGRDGAILYANPIFGSLFAAAGNVKGKAVRDILPPALFEHAQLAAEIEHALTSETPRLLTELSVSCAGVERILNIRVAPAHMPEGEGVLLVFEDVSEWRKAAALAEERRSYLDLIVSHVPVGVICCDLEGKFTYWGTGAQRLFGYDEKETLGNPNGFQTLGGQAELPGLIARCREVGSVEKEILLRRKDGRNVPVLVVLGRLIDNSERHVGYTAVVLDITERRRAEEELLREKQKLESVVGVIGAGLALIDRNHRIVWANRTIRDWFGRNGEVEGKFCHEIYCHRGQPCNACPSAQAILTGANAEMEVTLVRADGALRQYHHAVTPVVGPDGQVDHVLKLTLDVTDQTKKVYQLSRLRQLGELMQGVLDIDRLLHFVLTCVTAGQALGFNRAILFLVDSDRRVIEGRIGVGPDNAEAALRIWRSIAEEAPTLQDLLSRYDEEGARQTTAMNRIAQSIRIPLDNTSSIIAQCALGRNAVFVTDAARDPRVDQEFRRLVGSNQFVLAPLVAQDQPVGVILADNLYTGQTISQEHVELLCMFANQAALAIENAETYRRLQEEKVHLERAYRDLADAQDRLIRSERLAAIGRMAAHVAHEIRNPLVTIGGFAAALIRDQSPKPEDIHRYSEIITSEVRRLEAILARVMDFTKPPRPLLRETPLAPILNDVLDQFRARAAAQRVAIEFTAPPADLQLQLDPDQIKQVFINLVLNALDVMKEGGTLRVHAERNAQSVVIGFHNTGEPIRPEDLPSMFEPFFSTKPGGTGLGLAVSQKIAQDHGGDIRVASSNDQGTEFVVTLPLAARQRRAISNPAAG